MFLEVKANDRVMHKFSKRHGVCTRTLGMLAYVMWDGDSHESTINAAFLDKE